MEILQHFNWRIVVDLFRLVSLVNLRTHSSAKITMGPALTAGLPFAYRFHTSSLTVSPYLIYVYQRSSINFVQVSGFNLNLLISILDIAAKIPKIARTTQITKTFAMQSQRNKKRNYLSAVKIETCRFMSDCLFFGSTY